MLDKAGYVRIPFPPDYAIAVVDAGIDGFRLDGPTNGLHTPQTIYSQAEIDAILPDEQVQKDIHRTSWAFNDSEAKCLPSIEAMQEEANNVGLPLSLEEAQALCAFALTTRSEPEEQSLALSKLSAAEVEYLKNLVLSQENEVFEEIRSRILKNKWYGSIAFHIDEVQVLKDILNSLGNDEAARISAKLMGPLGVASLQGGACSFPFVAICNMWLSEGAGLHILNKKNDREHRVTRGVGNKLNVSFNLVSSDKCEGRSIYTQPLNKPLVLYSNHYEINRKEENFICTRMNDAEDRNLFIEDQFFHEHLIPAAKEKLDRVNFSADLDLNLEKELLFFIPLLNDNEFSKRFFNKLRDSTVNPETAGFLLANTKLCFGERPTFWQRHQSKIGLAIVFLILAALTVVSSILTFGVSAVVVAMGGALAFGFATALFGISATAIGGLIGKYIDDKRMNVLPPMPIVDPVSEMEQLFAGSQNDINRISITDDPLTTSTESSLLTPSFKESEKNIHSDSLFPPANKGTSQKPAETPDPKENLTDASEKPADESTNTLSNS